ncbi:MAG: zf-HC2 domain-containing protein [Thermomicrobiales bacterium]
MTIPAGGMPPPVDDELLSAWLDGRVSPAERAAVDAAIAADPAARARATNLRATVALLRGLPQPAPHRTFILTPEQGAAIRPARAAWVTRLFPAVSAASAVAAVLCIALVAGDLATGGFSTKRQGTTAPGTITSGATIARVTVAAAPAATAAAGVAGTTVSGVAGAVATAPRAAAANAPAAASAASSAQRPGAPAIGAAVIAPTVAGGTVALPPFTPTIGSFAASTIAFPATPTIVANAQPPPPTARAVPSGSATVTTETHRVPIALVRAGEILLALLAIAGIALAMLGWRGRTRRT